MHKRFNKTESHKIKQGIFLVIILIVIATVSLILTNQEMFAMFLFSLAVIFLLGFILWRYDFLLTLKEYERAVVFRYGKFARVGGPGWAFLVPVLESFAIVDLRTSTIDIPEQEVITKDEVVLKLDAVIYLFVNKDNESVAKSVVEIDDYKRAAEMYVQASIRDVAGQMTATELISNIQDLNERVRKDVEQIAKEWGVSVESVKISDIKLPREISDAMHEEKAQEQLKHARMQSALAHKAEIDAVKEAAEHLSDKALAYYYIRALEKLGEGKSTKFFFPTELTNLASAISGNVKEGMKASELDSLFKKYKPVIKKILEGK